jgi:hypothetical protein
MNMTRVAIGAFVAWIVDMVYGFVVYGMLLNGQFSRYPAVFRPADTITGMMPIMAAGGLLAMFALAYMYAKGYEGGSGVMEGLRFGLLLGIFAVGYIAVGDYVVLNIGRKLALSMAAAGLVEFSLVGLAIGAVYQAPRPAGTARA